VDKNKLTEGCDAGVPQNLLTLPKLTSFNQSRAKFSIGAHIPVTGAEATFGLRLHIKRSAEVSLVWRVQENAEFKVRFRRNQLRPTCRPIDRCRHVQTLGPV
jgi:hypothetical protein